MSRAMHRISLVLLLITVALLSLGFTSHGQSLRTTYSDLAFSALTSSAKTNRTSTGLNARAKAELGRHAWYLFHTVLSQHPDAPTQDERDDLQQWVTSFTRLYPCKSCAAHFQTLLDQFPPQTSSRVAAAMWGCSMHNLVNSELKKKEYDCSKILDDYDCGCGTTST